MATSPVSPRATATTAAIATAARAASPRPRRRRGGLNSTARSIDRIADAPDSTDRAGRAQLRPQLGHVDVDRAGAGGRCVPPHLAEQLFAGEDPTWPAHERVKEVELGCGERHLGSVCDDRTAVRV